MSTSTPAELAETQKLCVKGVKNLPKNETKDLIYAKQQVTK